MNEMIEVVTLVKPLLFWPFFCFFLKYIAGVLGERSHPPNWTSEDSLHCSCWSLICPPRTQLEVQFSWCWGGRWRVTAGCREPCSPLPVRGHALCWPKLVCRKPAFPARAHLLGRAWPVLPVGDLCCPRILVAAPLSFPSPPSSSRSLSSPDGGRARCCWECVCILHSHLFSLPSRFQILRYELPPLHGFQWLAVCLHASNSSFSC